MTLITAHKILIGSGAAFFLFFAVLRFAAYGTGDDIGVLVSAIAGLAAAVGLATYFRTIGSR